MEMKCYKCNNKYILGDDKLKPWVLCDDCINRFRDYIEFEKYLFITTSLIQAGFRQRKDCKFCNGTGVSWYDQGSCPDGCSVRR